MSSIKRSDRKARRIASRTNKVKTRNIFVGVVIELIDGTIITVTVPLVGQFVVIDTDGTKRLYERSGTYHRTVRAALASIKVGEHRVRNARIINPAVAV